MTENVLRIEVNEKGTHAFYKEVVSATYQYQGLMKKPERKLRDSFKELKIYILICAALFAALAAMGFVWGFDGITIGGMIVTLAGLFFAALVLKNLSSMVKNFLADPKPSVLILDEAGVELNKEGAQVIRTAWDNVAFVRVFRESVCFFSKGVRGLVIAVNRGREEEVLDYLNSNDIKVRIIGR